MRLSIRAAAQLISTIGCANGHGGRHLGCEHAVKVLKSSQFLNNTRVGLRWRQIVEETTSGRNFEAMAGVRATCSQLADATRKAIEDKEELLVFGGDHSCAMGTWSGIAAALRQLGDIGLIWVDAHMDAHTPSSSPSGNPHGMPVAHLLGFGDASLTTLSDAQPKILPHNFCMVGIRSFEQPEQELLERLGVRIFYMNEVEKRGLVDVMHEAQYIVSRNTIGYGLSIDIDGFDVRCAPAVGTPEPEGMDSAEFLRALLTMDLSRLIATEIVEFLPEYDDERKTSERLVASLVDTIYSTKFFQTEFIDKILAETKTTRTQEKKHGFI